jgi:hypothetical protein
VARRCFELSTTVPGVPADVVDFLMDLERHRGLHPFLVSAEIEASGSSHHGPWWDWRVVERPRVGPFRYQLRFRARMTRTSPTSMESRVRALPGCQLRGRTRAVPAPDGGTMLTESVVAIAPFLLVGYLARQARAAHAQTYQRLPAALTAEQETLPDGAAGPAG